MHPTVKPVALIADVLRDCSKRGEVVLDGFGGSGSTLLSALQRKKVSDDERGGQIPPSPYQRNAIN